MDQVLDWRFDGWTTWFLKLVQAPKMEIKVDDDQEEEDNDDKIPTNSLDLPFSL